MKMLATRVRPVLSHTGIACALVVAAANLAAAQELGSAGDRVEVTWGGKPTMAKVDTCTSTSCYVFLYDDVSGGWSDGTAFFPQREIRGLRSQAKASAAPNAASGALTERVAAGLQASGKFDQAGAMFQRAADAYRAEGNSAGTANALRESAAAYEKQADTFLVGTPDTAPRMPDRVAAAPAAPQGQRVVAAAPAAGAIPSGHYGCLFGSGGSPGYVDIRGGTYRGPTLTASGAFRPYAMGAMNSITWTAGFGEFNVISSEYMGISGDTTHRPWFAVLYRTPGGGNDRLDCEQE
jgi:hypothetical protein